MPAEPNSHSVLKHWSAEPTTGCAVSAEASGTKKLLNPASHTRL